MKKYQSREEYSRTPYVAYEYQRGRGDFPKMRGMKQNTTMLPARTMDPMIRYRRPCRATISRMDCSSRLKSGL